MTTTSDARTFAALGDPTRLEIVTRLTLGPASVSELARPLPMSLRAVLKHVEILEDVGIVRTVKEGRVRECRLEPAALDRANRCIEDLRTRWERRIDRLEQVLREEGEAK
jgi:DNA-binding transcriptional ArsR family regulator